MYGLVLKARKKLNKATAEIVRTQVAGHKYLDDIIRVPFEYRDGHLVVPEGPGLGIEVDEAKLAKYRVA